MPRRYKTIYPTCKKDIADLKKILVDAMRFITNTKGRGPKGAMEKPCLPPLEQRRKTKHIDLFLKMLGKENNIQLSALFMKIRPTTQLRALYRLTLKGTALVSGG